MISLKSSDVKVNYEAYKIVNDRSDYPLHIGVTEAGTPSRGKIKSAAGVGALLLEDIGDTMRISLTADPGRRSALCKGTAGGFRHQKGCDRNRFLSNMRPDRSGSGKDRGKHRTQDP